MPDSTHHSPCDDPRPRIAVVATICTPRTHADIFLWKLLEGYRFKGRQYRPSLRVTRCYVAQQPPDDLSGAIAAPHHISLVDSIRDALLDKDGRLAVDGVLLVAEHGDYPMNARGQKLYPRSEFFREITACCTQAGQRVPVFNDKHLSHDWPRAQWMYDTARTLGMPLMAGSSLPVTWRIPPLELAMETPLDHAVVASFGHKESYGFHALESLQCMVERREGGETGVRAVQYLEGAAIWEWTDAHPWVGELLSEALGRSVWRAEGSPRQIAKRPNLFVLEYGDGFTAAVYQLNGAIISTSFAGRLRRGRMVSTRFHRQEKPWGQFSALVHYIEQFIATGTPPYPVERTLLTTGVLAALMESSAAAGRMQGIGPRIATPHLAISYQPPLASLFDRGPITPEDEAPRS